MTDEYENEVAVYEAERNRAWHSWFAARGHISPTDEHTLIFDGGFRMAWEFCRAQPAPGTEAWQPIETAARPFPGEPGFGVRILVVVDGGEGTLSHVRICWWQGDRWSFDGHQGSIESLGYRATHWQPLPEPPAHSAGSGKAGHSITVQESDSATGLLYSPGPYVETRDQRADARGR